MKKHILNTGKPVKTLFAGLMALVLSSVPVSAATGYVTTDELNIRSAPSSSADIIDRVYEGDELLVTYGPEDGWVEVYYNGNCCYVASSYISIGGSSSSEAYDDEAYDSKEYDDYGQDTDGEQDDYENYREAFQDDSSQNLQYLGEFTLTGYCNCAACCGTAGNQTASGTWPTAGVTVAMGGVDFGTQLMINGNIYTVEDRGTPYGHVDIYFDSHEDALAFGMQSADVYLVG